MLSKKEAMEMVREQQRQEQAMTISKTEAAILEQGRRRQWVEMYRDYQRMMAGNGAVDGAALSAIPQAAPAPLPEPVLPVAKPVATAEISEEWAQVATTSTRSWPS